MTVTKRSVLLTSLNVFRRVIKAVLWVLILGFLVIFGLQYPHSPQVETLWFVTFARRFGDPAVTRLSGWFELFPGTAPYTKYIPLALALAIWVVKTAVDSMLQRAYRQIRGPLRPAPPPPAYAPPFPVAQVPVAAPGASASPLPGAGPQTVVPDSEQARQELLKRYSEIEQALKAAQRKLCAFLSIEVVRPAQLKMGEDTATVAATFHAYEAMLKDIFAQHGAWKQAWTTEGVLVCLLDRELAVAAARRALLSMENFNATMNKLQNLFRIRCGISEGEVAIYEDSQLERLVDPVIDLATYLQKQARPNSLWISSEVHSRLADKSGFHLTDQTVHGIKIYQWSAQPRLEPGAAPGEATHALPLAESDLEAGGSRVLRVGRYEILQELGRGAMGAVYKARDPQLERTVAIKIILTASLPANDLRQYKQRFYREARAAGQMTHPGVVTIYDVAEEDTGQPYLVMEYVEGTTLDNLLSPAEGGPPRKLLPLTQSLEIAIQVADALDYAHRRGVVHRDIKPANILVTSDGKAKIADFGVAKLPGAELTQTGQLVGTPAFMSPEQLTGDPVDGRSDIFSFGAVLYSMFTGERPFPADTVTAIIFKVIQTPHTPARSLNPQLPGEIDIILARCLAKKPDDRYSAARALAADLEAVKAGRPLADTPLSPA